MENPCQIPEYCKNLEKPKKTKWQNLCPSGYQNIAKTSKNQKKQKKQNGRTYVPVSGMGSILLFFFLFFCFSQVKPKNQKNQNGRTYVPVSGMGSILLFFFVFLLFPGKTKKPKKTKCRTYVPVSGMGSVLLFFLVFPGKTKKTKWQNLCPSVWHGVSTFVFFGFFGFPR